MTAMRPRRLSLKRAQLLISFFYFFRDLFSAIAEVGSVRANFHAQNRGALSYFKP